MVVDDLQNLRLIETGDRLCDLIVVDQHDALAARADQVIARDRTDDALIFVQNGVAAVAAFEHTLAHIIHIIVQMEAHNVLRVADAADGDGLIDQPHRAVGVKGRGDDAGFRGQAAQLLVQLGLTKDHAAHVHFQCTPDHIRLVPADDNGILTGEKQVFTALWQCNAHVARDGVHKIAGFVQNAPFQHAQKIENRNFFDMRALDGAHVVACNVPGRQHAEQRAVLVGHGDGRDGRIGRQHGPCAADRQRRGQRGWRVVVQVAYLRAHGLDPSRRSEAEAVEHELRFVADVAEARRAVFAVAKRIAQRGIGHGRDDGIRIRVAVPCHINRIHDDPPIRSFTLILSVFSVSVNAFLRGKDCTFRESLI